jgi:hypothetical protein
VILQRKLRAMYCGKEEYRPEQMPLRKYVPVIGYTHHKRTITKNGRNDIVDQPFLICIGNNGIPIEIVMFNLKVMIDERELDYLTTLSQMVRNLTIIGKSLCERVKDSTNCLYAENVQEEIRNG